MATTTSLCQILLQQLLHLYGLYWYNNYSVSMIYTYSSYVNRSSTVAITMSL